MPPLSPFRSSRGHEHAADLLRDAIRVEHGEDPAHSHPVKHSTHTVKKIVEVPYEETVRVPVKKKVATVGVEQKVMRGVELVPVKKYKEVEETVIEVHEEKVQGVREVWVKKKVPYTEIVKKPVKVTKVRKIPYTDYVEKEVEVTVDVPCHKVQVHKGYRDDRVLRTKLVEIEQDVTLEHRPTLHSEGVPRVREIGGHDHGVVERGHSHVHARPMSARPTHSRNHAALGLEWNVGLSRRGGQLLGVQVEGDGSSVVVQRVDAGLLDDWNARHPNRAVRAGDRIVAVNGRRGDSDELVRWLGQGGQLDITVSGHRSTRARGRSGSVHY